MLKLSLLHSKGFSSFIYTNQNVVKFAFATLNPTACCYDILGLKKNATDNEIKQAYLSLGTLPTLISQPAYYIAFAYSNSQEVSSWS